MSKRAIPLVLALLVAGCGEMGGLFDEFAPMGAMEGDEPTFAAQPEAAPQEIVVQLRRGPNAFNVLRAFNVRVMASNTANGLALVHANGDRDETIARMMASGRVAMAEPNYVYHLQINTRLHSGFVDSNDPRFAEQWGYAKINAPLAWANGALKPVAVAVVDTGVDLNHPDLKERLLPGYNAIERGQPPKDDNGHGTHVAGTVGAINDNGIGVAGMAPNARILPVRVLGGAGSGSLFGIADGIRWASDHGANVINLSLGGPSDSQILASAIQDAIRSGVTVVAAMGNSGKNEKLYPAAYPGVIAVGATDPADQKASFSTMGSHIAVSAPGVKILSTMPTYDCWLTKNHPDKFQKEYSFLNGTSMATPHVAGLAALVIGANRAASPEQVRKVIQSAVVDLGKPGADDDFGTGRIDAAKALGLSFALR